MWMPVAILERRSASFILARYDNWAPALKQGLITIDQAHASLEAADAEP